MFEKEVANGAAWLDENYPGWESRIDFGSFSIVECEHCIIGQTVCDFLEISMDNRSEFFYGLDVSWRRDHGFDMLDWNKQRKQAIELAWTTLIKERFSSGNLS